MLYQFRGGAAIRHEKHRTAGKPIEKLPLPAKLCIHMSQHTGAPAQATVAVGDLIKKGQCIGAAHGFFSAAIHAPTSGKVAEIVDIAHPNGIKGRAIVLETDGADTWLEGLPTERDWRGLGPKEIVEILQSSGIVGLGGACFPTHVKLSPPPGTHIHTVLLNGAECEPFLTSDDAVMRTYPQDVVTGLEIIVKVLGAEKVAIGIEENKPEAIKALTEACKKVPNCRVEALPGRYPQGAERSVIKALTGMWLPAGKLPMTLGVLVQNVGSCSAIANAVARGIPLIERVITVTGPAVREPKNVLAPIGTSWADLLAFCGGTTEDLGRLVMGGPMMGIAQDSLDLPLVKGSSGLLALRKVDAASRVAGPCIRCGNCVNACPMGLAPLVFPAMARTRRWDDAQTNRVLECIECGTCEFVCPASRSMVHSVRVIKSSLRKIAAAQKPAAA
jgi:electron transport complex protein RnfC